MDHTLQLPAEVLCHIFHFIQLVNSIPTVQYISEARDEGDLDLDFRYISPRSLRTAEYRVRLLAWILVTHVCSRWRTLALSDTSLWTAVPATLGKNWLREFFIRSREQAIYLDWGQSMPESRAALTHEVKADIVGEQHWRLRNFSALLYHYSGNPLLSVLALSWPELEELDIALDGAATALPLIPGHAPRLRRLRYITDTSCELFIWSTLNKLVVLDVLFSKDKHGLSMVACLDALRCMPGLQHLRLECGDSLNEEGEDAGDYFRIHHISPQCTCRSAASTRSQLVSLKTMVLKARWSAIHHILLHIIPPPSTRVSITAQDFDINPDGDGADEITHAIVSPISDLIRGWQRAQNEPGTLDSGTYSHTAPYVALAVILDWDARYESCIVRHLLSRSPAFSQKLADEDWCEGRDGVHFDLEICCRLPYAYEDTFVSVAAMMIRFLRALGVSSIIMLSFRVHKKVNTEYKIFDPYFDLCVFISRYLSDPMFQDLKILLLPELSYQYISPIVELAEATPEDEESSSASDGGVHGLFPKLIVIDFTSCLPKKRIASQSIPALKKLLNARLGLCVYLRITDRTDSSVVSVFNTMPRARVISRRTKVDYAGLLGLSLSGSSDIAVTETEDEETDDDASEDGDDEEDEEDEEEEDTDEGTDNESRV